MTMTMAMTTSRLINSPPIPPISPKNQRTTRMMATVQNRSTIPYHRVTSKLYAGGLIKLDVRVFRMSEEEIKGRGKQAKGKIREEAGKMTDNKTNSSKERLSKLK